MKTALRILAASFLCFCCFLNLVSSASAAAADPSLDDVIKNIQSNQNKIQDMYAETTTTITSNLRLTTEDKTQKMVQKGKMWSKGNDKSKIEIVSPMKQTTVTNGDKMAIVNPETGQKIVQDLNKMREKSGIPGSSKQMGLDKAKEFFDLSVKRHETGDSKLATEYVISGIPKKENKFLGKMEFYVDSEKWVPTKIMMYDAKGKPMSQSEIEYQEIEGVWVPVRNSSNITTPAGAMKVEMEFSNVKVNKGVSDREFSVD